MNAIGVLPVVSVCVPSLLIAFPCCCPNALLHARRTPQLVTSSPADSVRLASSPALSAPPTDCECTKFKGTPPPPPSAAIRVGGVHKGRRQKGNRGA
jgi:hypothetical protein